MCDFIIKPGEGEIFQQKDFFIHDFVNPLLIVDSKMQAVFVTNVIVCYFS
jgi:hypothetical protein